MKALVEEVGEWNTMIAAAFGALNDAVDGSSSGVVAPIMEFPNFEQLEFKGRQNHKYLAPFLNAMTQLGDLQREATVK